MPSDFPIVYIYRLQTIMWLLHTYEKPTLSTIHGIVYRQFINAPLPKPMVHLLRYTKKSVSVYFESLGGIEPPTCA